MQYVYVLNKHGEPLMPCSPGKARLLLKQQKACVVKRTPFTIKLLYGSAGYKQPITLGVDAGSKHVGLSASTENARTLPRRVYSSQRCGRFAFHAQTEPSFKAQSQDSLPCAKI